MVMGLDGKSIEKYSVTVALKDGSSLILRPIQLSDEEKLLALFNRLSKETIYLRFHHVVNHITREEARRFCTVDYFNTFALVGTLGEDEEEKIIAVGHYAREPGAERAQIAFEVEDKYQGLGIGTHLLDQLAYVARDKGITQFEAEVLAENKDMMNILINSGFKMHRMFQGSTYVGILDVAPTEISEQKSFERERVSSIASLRTFLNPKSVAVIGASRRRNTIGNFVFRNLIQQDFKGVVYPVNPFADVIAAVKAYPSVQAVPGDVDLAIIAVPKDHVQQVAEECVRKGLKGMIVMSSGFSDAGPEGAEAERKLIKTARSYGIRLLGPNCMGIINANPEINLNATFSSVFPPHGTIAFATESGVLPRLFRAFRASRTRLRWRLTPPMAWFNPICRCKGRLSPPQILGHFCDIDRLDAMFDDTSGINNVMQGQGEHGVRSSGHASQLARLGSSRVKKRAMIIEDCLEKLATLTLQIKQRYTTRSHRAEDRDGSAASRSSLLIHERLCCKGRGHSNSPHLR